MFSQNSIKRFTTKAAAKFTEFIGGGPYRFSSFFLGKKIGISQDRRRQDEERKGSA